MKFSSFFQESRVDKILKVLQSKLILVLTILLLLLSLLISCAILFLYFFHFRGSLSNEQTVWGAFGSLLSGIFGPVLSFAAVIAALLTINQRSNESKKREVSQKSSVFETSFFNLFHNHVDLISSFIYYDRSNNKELKGRKFFIDSVKRINQFMLNDTTDVFVNYHLERPERIPDEFMQIVQDVFPNSTLDLIFLINRLGIRNYKDTLKTGTLSLKESKCQFSKLLLGELISQRKSILSEIVKLAKNEKVEALIKGYYNTFDNECKLTLHNSAYIAFYDEFGGEVGFYFRNLANTLSFIEEKCPIDADKYRYAKLIRAQLSRFEIALLYYNCLSEYSSDEFNSLISKNKFNMLKGIYSPDLFDNINFESLLKLRGIEIELGKVPVR